MLAKKIDNDMAPEPTFDYGLLKWVVGIVLSIIAVIVAPLIRWVKSIMSEHASNINSLEKWKSEVDARILDEGRVRKIVREEVGPITGMVDKIENHISGIFSRIDQLAQKTSFIEGVSLGKKSKSE